MSEPKLISPLLDGFVMGSPMSSHDGVRCYPAMKENSDNKYIVKVISIPASQVQLDALLLTGAYKDPADAMDYFKEQSEGVVKEAEALQKMAKLEGFLPFEGWQVVPMDGGKLGYEVYLLSSYKRSLEKYMRRHLMTHLEAVNLGLDLCQALSICRKAGLLYVDLKPGNVFISREKQYRIGDLGFVELDSLQYTSLPGKYAGPYSPPETRDALKTLNETVDTYAVGMILYQIYNEGNLPAAPKEPDEPFPSPANADYEISEIIMKAVHPDPKERWQDPIAMGQALVAYMQRNSINNTPIKPPSADLSDVTPVSETAPAEQPAELAFLGEMVNDETAPSEQDAADAKVTEATSGLVAQADDLISHDTPEGVVIPETVELPEPEPILPAEPEPAEPEQEAEHPEKEKEKEDDDEDFRSFLADEEDDEDDDEPEVIAEPQPIQKQRKPRREKRPKKPIGKGLLVAAIVVLILALLGVGGFYFYQTQYLQTIDSLTIEGSLNELTVTVDTNVDNSLLTVTCTDTYGNAQTKSVTNGQAVFTDLLPNSQYKIQLTISGFHKLVGQTTDIFNTDSQTNIVSMTAVTGSEDGSALLTLTVDGHEYDAWVVTCTAEGEQTITETFTGHNVTIKGLTVGKLYTFQLSTSDNAELQGQTSLEFTASRLVTAEDLSIVSCSGGEMTVRWNAPEDVAVESWTVRCYGGSYEQILDTTDTEVMFTGIESSVAYTVEVTASGMTTPTRTTVTANPITITNFNVNEEDPGKLTLSWEYEGEAPVGGWLLMYRMGKNDIQSVVKCSDATAEISPRIYGAAYSFTIQSTDSTSIFNNVHTYSSANADIFSTQGLSAEKITAHLLKTPETEDWTYESVGDESFTSTFTSGDKISVVLKASDNFYLESEEINVLYVIRDSEGSVISELLSKETIDWEALWYDGDYHYGELDVPKAPTAAGEYSLSLYFNNAAVIYINFSVTE